MVGMMQERPAYVEFELRAMEDREKSIEAGHAVYKDVAYAIVTPPGGNLVTEKNAEKWLADLQKRNDPNARHYQASYDAWKAGLEAPVDGTRVEDWPSITPAQIKQLRAGGVRTVEDLAAANENTVNRIGMGGRALKQKAQAWLDSASGAGKAAEELNALRQRTKEQDDTIQDLMKKVEGLQAALGETKPKRGRPRKDAD